MGNGRSLTGPRRALQLLFANEVYDNDPAHYGNVFVHLTNAATMKGVEPEPALDAACKKDPRCLHESLDSALFSPGFRVDSSEIAGLFRRRDGEGRRPVTVRERKDPLSSRAPCNSAPAPSILPGLMGDRGSFTGWPGRCGRSSITSRESAARRRSSGCLPGPGTR